MNQPQALTPSLREGGHIPIDNVDGNMFPIDIVDGKLGLGDESLYKNQQVIS